MPDRGGQDNEPAAQWLIRWTLTSRSQYRAPGFQHFGVDYGWLTTANKSEMAIPSSTVFVEGGEVNTSSELNDESIHEAADSDGDRGSHRDETEEWGLKSAYATTAEDDFGGYSA
nr:unnamed protein product [Spirometra erinaceieuropaei]